MYPSVDALLAPETLSAFAGVPITEVSTGPLPDVDSQSGSEILAIKTNHGQGPLYVLKRVTLDADWIMRATEDWACREVVLWQTGLLDRLPPEVVHAILACARDGDGWALLMRDVGSSLIPWADKPATPLTSADNARVLDCLAALHVAFWGAPSLLEAELGLCTLRHRYSVMSPASGRNPNLPYSWTRWLSEGWERLDDFVASDVAAVLRGLLDDPRPLCAALQRYPQTLIHGDPRVTNIGLIREPRSQIVLLDWALTGPGPPAVDLAWYLADIVPPISYDRAIAQYRESLSRRLGSRFDEEWWRPQLELSLLGCVLQFGWSIAEQLTHRYTYMVLHWSLYGDWWSEQVRAGARWLPSPAGA